MIHVEIRKRENKSFHFGVWGLGRATILGGFLFLCGIMIYFIWFENNAWDHKISGVFG